MANGFVCICGPYRPDQPRVWKLAAALAKKMPVTFIVMSGSGKNVTAVGGKSKPAYILNATRFLRSHLDAGDVVLGYGHGGALAAYFGTRGLSASFWYDYPDPWAGWYHHRQPSDSLKWQVGRVAFSKIEHRMYHEADLVTTASYEQLRFLEKRHGTRNNAQVILNCPDTRMFHRVKPATRVSMGLPKHARVLLYLGSILEEYGCRTLVQMMPALLRKNPDAYLVFLGSAKKPEFMAQLQHDAERLSVSDHVIFLPPVPSADVPAYLSAAQIGYVPFKDILYNNVGSPNKLFEYMACGAVPIASDMAEFRHYLKNGKNGVLVRPEKPEAFADATARLLSAPARMDRMGKDNLVLAQRKYNWQHQEKRLMEALSCLP